MITRMVGYLSSLLALLVLVASCGGGGSVVAEGGIGGTGISYGKITGFGSVISNGVTFNTENATFTKDDLSVTQADLRVGMVVSIQGEIDDNGTTGTADSVTYFNILKGPVQGAPGANSFVAMGQTIIVDGLTKYEPNTITIADLNNNDVVEISGFYRADGSILATYVEFKAGYAGEYEIIGEVSNIVIDTSFDIGAPGSLQVNVTSTTGLQTGDLVKAEGTIVAGELNATSVNPLNKGLELEDADDAELEGVATTACGATAPCSFEINFVTVNVSTATQVKGGLVDAIQPGVRLEVEGELVNGVINAREVEFEDGIELISTVSSVNAGAGQITLEYGPNDIIVTVDENTENPDYAGLDSMLNQHVKVRAKDDGTIRAVRIETDGGNEVVLQAPLQAENPDTDLTLLGVNIVVTAPGFQFVDSRTDPETLLPDATTFFNLVAPGDLVKAKGTIDINVITWDEAEIE